MCNTRNARRGVAWRGVAWRGVCMIRCLDMDEARGRIVAGGILEILSTPMGKRREFMYVCAYVDNCQNSQTKNTSFIIKRITNRIYRP